VPENLQSVHLLQLAGTLLDTLLEGGRSRIGKITQVLRLERAQLVYVYFPASQGFALESDQFTTSLLRCAVEARRGLVQFALRHSSTWVLDDMTKKSLKPYEVLREILLIMREEKSSRPLFLVDLLTPMLPGNQVNEQQVRKSEEVREGGLGSCAKFSSQSQRVNAGVSATSIVSYKLARIKFRNSDTHKGES
jgi:hypothetical protein